MARSSGGANRKFPNVRFGSKADMCSAKGHVRSTPERDIRQLIRGTDWTQVQLTRLLCPGK
jgi:hypothetical protein